MDTGTESRGNLGRWLSRLREPRAAFPLLIAVPIPLAVALAVTARPFYPEDSCSYGAPRSSLQATDEYLNVMTPLGMFALVVIAAVALPIHAHWRLLAPAVIVWAAVALIWTDAARPVMVYGAHVTVFGAFLVVPVLVIGAVAGREFSWIRAIGWVEFLYVLPLLLGLAGLLAQPACFAGNPPAPIPR